MNDLRKYKPLFEGLGIGLFLGVAIGLAQSDAAYLGLSVVALAAAGYRVSKQGLAPQTSPTDAYRAGSIGLAAVVGMLAGIWLREQAPLRPSAAQRVAYWTQAGFGADKARALVLDEWNIRLRPSLVAPAAQGPTDAPSARMPDSVSIGHAKAIDSLQRQVDSLRSTIDELIEIGLAGGGGSPSGGSGNGASANLFSSEGKESWCTELDPDAMLPDTAAYLHAVATHNGSPWGQWAPNGLTNAQRLAFYQLLHPLACALETKARSGLCAAIDPALADFEPEACAELCTQQELPELSKLVAFAQGRQLADDLFFVNLHKWACSLKTNSR